MEGNPRGPGMVWGLKDKENLKFVNLDIETFYPNINEDLLRRALDWAGMITHIEELEKNIIMHARKGF